MGSVPTANFRVLYVFIVLSHNRRQVIHFNVTEHPTAQWTVQQLLEAFPFDSSPRYLLCDRVLILRRGRHLVAIGYGLAIPYFPRQEIE